MRVHGCRSRPRNWHIEGAGVITGKLDTITRVIHARPAVTLARVQQDFTLLSSGVRVIRITKKTKSELVQVLNAIGELNVVFAIIAAGPFLGGVAVSPSRSLDCAPEIYILQGSKSE